MNILAIGYCPGDLEIGCFGTLSKYVKKGHQAYLIVASKSEQEWSEKKIKVMKESARKIRGHLSLTDKIDYSAVTQDNVYFLRSLMHKIKPSVLFIPSEKANKQRVILAKSALLSFRQTKLILMYEVGRHSNFSPCVYSIITDEVQIKKSCLAVYARIVRFPKKTESLARLRARDLGIDGFVEAFECPKMLLDGEFQL